MPDPKILVIVCHALYEPWKSILYQGQLKTWAETSQNQIWHSHAVPTYKLIRALDSNIWRLKWNKRFGKFLTVIEIVLKSPFRVQKGDLVQGKLPNTKNLSLKLRMPDLDMLMNFKSFAVITGTLQFDYDFLVLTTSSSYLNLVELKKKINELPQKKVVAGRILNQGSIKFASGSFRVFSRDVVEDYLIHRKQFSNWRPEDQAFGYLAYKVGMDLNYIDISSIDIDSLDSLKKITNADLLNVVHFRLKSGTLDNRSDISIMLELHQRLISDTKR